MFLVRKLVLSLLAASLCPQGLAKSAEEAFNMLEADFYKSTPQDLAEVHNKFTAYLNRTNRVPSHPPPRVLPKIIQLSNATASEVDKARVLVDEAIEQQGKYNMWRIQNPRRGTGKGPNAAQSRRREAGPAPPELTPELLAAIKIVNDVDTQEMHNNGTLQQNQRNITKDDLFSMGSGAANGGVSKRYDDDWDGSDWLSDQDHSLSQQPFHPDKDYKVWRNVKDYGAVGDGVTDDTKAIQKAIDSGRRCGRDCPESSISGAIVVFPGGDYLVSSPIVLYYNTQILTVGSKIATLKSARNFFGLGLVTTDVYLGDGHSEWYLNTANFYRSVRAMAFDISNTRTKGMVAVHWQTAQATTLEQSMITMSNSSDTTQIGVFAENGSGGWMGDLTIFDGDYGILAGSQQYSASRINIYGSKKCIGLIWNWVWSWSHLELELCGIGIDITGDGADEKSPPGSLSVVDSAFVHCDTAIRSFPFDLHQADEQGTTLISLSNTRIYETPTFIDFTKGSPMKSESDNWEIDYWQYGNRFEKGTVVHGQSDATLRRPAGLLDSNGRFYSQGKPANYRHNEDKVVNARIHAAGDGETDDTVALQSLLDYCAANSFLLFIPAGTYIISSPILIPTNSRIQGEVWSQLMAVGDKFKDASHPKAMLTVGQGETDGFVQMENLLFTSRGSLPGLGMLQWNLKSSKQGDVSLRDCHFRVGGAVGTDLQKADCPKLTGSVDPKCIAGAIMLVKTDKGGGYFENMWAWVADHDLDDPKGDESNQISIYFGRGVLIFGDAPTWWRGTASEHSVMYQYNIYNASNVYMSIIQTESPYFQGTAFAQAPAPFKVDNWVGEPTFDTCGENTTNCNAAWALMVQKSTGVYIDGAGLYSWFQNYDQSTCVENSDCQQRLVNVFQSSNVYISHLVTIGAAEAMTPGFSNAYNRIIYVKDSLEAKKYPWWTGIGVYLDSYDDINTSDNGGLFPIHNGFVSFGDSYAAGIGTLTPLDNKKDCYRGRGAYPAVLNSIVRSTHPGVSPDWQMLACSGETAEQFINGAGANQLSTWIPDSSDAVTISFTGNDFHFGKIVAACIMGYPRFGRDKQCKEGRADAKADLEKGEKVSDLVFEILDGILKKAGSKRMHIYWTGYPRFFDASTNRCDGAYFTAGGWFSGSYLTQDLRRELNHLSNMLNEQLAYAIRRYRASQTYKSIYFINPDDDDDLALYKGHRFCEPGANETQKTADLQKNVAFFYDRGYDDIPSEEEGYFKPPKRTADAPNDWSIPVNSGTCSEDSVPGLELLPIGCTAAKLVANGTVSANTIESDGDFNVTMESDGTVSAQISVSFTKMFHPKTRANWRIAQFIHEDLRRRQDEN